VPIAIVTIVVDASAITAIVFDEEASPDVQRRLANANLVAPTLLAFEIANACVTRERRQGRAEVAALGSYSIFLGWKIAMLPVSEHQVVALALMTGLTAYDASYLWLARHLQCALVTLDRRLQAAASAIP
jgi:predicted nucleic acid-binding protein